jgi:hypothetical protein
VSLPLARNADPILAARRRGLKPGEMVMVSLVGRIDSANITVFADPDIAYDWRWVHGLDVCVWIGDEPHWVSAVKAIAQARPDYLCVWHCRQGWGARIFLVPTAEDVSKPKHLWSFELDYLEWLDFQNRDFIEGRTYQSTQEEPRNESHPRQHRLQCLHGGGRGVPHHSRVQLPRADHCAVLPASGLAQVPDYVVGQGEGQD